MQRIAFLVLILYVVWRLLTAWGRKKIQEGDSAESFSRFSPKSRQRRRQNAEIAEVGELKACSRCGTYVPADRLTADTGGGPVCRSGCRGADESAGASASHE